MLYLIRHGQTEFNAAGRWQGQVDSPLTARGNSQALNVARKLRELVDPDETAIFSSPLMRAHTTAAIISRTLSVQSDIVLDPRLMEVRMGRWDGLTNVEIEERWPGARAGLAAGEWFFHAPDGETYSEMSQRVAEALREIRNSSSATKVIVCHGVTSRIVRGLHMGLPKSAMLELEVPQDAIFALCDRGRVNLISCVEQDASPG